MTDFENLKRLLGEVRISADRANAENAAKHAAEMQNIHDLALVTSEVLQDTNVKNVMTVTTGVSQTCYGPANLKQDLNLMVTHMRAELNDILDAQTTQSTNIQHQLRLSEDIAANQKSSLAWSQQLKGNAAHLASELDSATGLAGRMSHRLEHVNQALGRVERASSTLSTIFAIIAIPSRMFDFLHLRLLGIFALPTLILYFCKPWRYSCILITLYGKTPAYPKKECRVINI